MKIKNRVEFTQINAFGDKIKRSIVELGKKCNKKLQNYRNLYIDYNLLLITDKNAT